MTDDRRSTSTPPGGRSVVDAMVERPLKAAMLYAAFGVTWIIGTDMLVDNLIADPANLVLSQTAKGLLYIAVTTALVYWLVARAVHGVERKQTERQLQSTSALLEKLFATVGDSVILVDPATRTIVQCNPAVERMFGYTMSELIGASTEILHVDYQSFLEFGSLSKPVVDKQGLFRTEFRMKRKDGMLVDTEHTVSVLHDESGQRKIVISIIRDITERKAADAALRESEGRFRTLLQNVPSVAIQGYGLDGQVHYWNRASEILYGYTAEEALAGNLLELIVPPEMRDAVAAELRRVTKGGEIDNGELSLMRKDGSRVSVYSSHAVVRRPGQPPELFCIDIDLTNLKTLEEQLRQSQRLEAIGQLTGGIAHDFNNLLTVIQGNAEMLTEALEANANLRPLAEMITSASFRGADLTRYMLAFARKQTLEPRAVDINELVGGMDGLLRRSLGEHIEIHLDCREGLWNALIDPAQLESALLNLTLNARDAMPQGGQLTIETNNAELDQDYADNQVDVKPGKYVMVVVSDTGVGISADRLERVFEPFYTTKEKGMGTGLGLSMVYGFIKQSNGHIMIYSEPGEGTTVRMYLPRMEENMSLPAEGVPDPVTATGGKETILLLEDDDLVRTYAQGQLTELGYSVISATTGPEALEIIRQRSDIDLLFTDIVMPGGMSGRQVADAAVALRPGMKVLYTSGYTENAIVDHGRLDPGVQLLPKPYRRGELASRVRGVLDQPASAVPKVPGRRDP